MAKFFWYDSVKVGAKEGQGRVAGRLVGDDLEFVSMSDVVSATIIRLIGNDEFTLPCACLLRETFCDVPTGYFLLR
jgi:hypothetical protein